MTVQVFLIPRHYFYCRLTHRLHPYLLLGTKAVHGYLYHIIIIQMIIGVIFLPSEVNKIKYIFQFIKNHPYSPKGVEFIYNPTTLETCDQVIWYGLKEVAPQTSAYCIPRQNCLLNHQPHEPLPPLYANHYVWEGNTLFSVETTTTKEQQPFFAENLFGFDLLVMLFFHLSRLEEYHVGSAYDSLGRRHTSSYFLVKEGLTETPVVDDLVRSFWQVMGLTPQTIRAHYSISHDVDYVRKFSSYSDLWRNLAGTFYHGRSWAEFMQNFRAYQQAKQDITSDPYYAFPFLFRASGVYRSKQLYLLAGGEHPHERPYDLDAPKVREMIFLAKSRDYQVGLHPSTRAARDEHQFEQQKKHLEKILQHPIVISRQHYLLFLFPQTLHILQNQGIQEDSSLGYRDCLGYRCGTAFPYYLYDLVHNQESTILEKPLIFMDSALWHQTNYDPKSFISKMFTFIQSQPGSAMHFNFHNSFFDSTLPGYAVLKQAYLDLTKTMENT